MVYDKMQGQIIGVYITTKIRILTLRSHQMTGKIQKLPSLQLMPVCFFKLLRLGIPNSCSVTNLLCLKTTSGGIPARYFLLSMAIKIHSVKLKEMTRQKKHQCRWDVSRNSSRLQPVCICTVCRPSLIKESDSIKSSYLTSAKIPSRRSRLSRSDITSYSSFSTYSYFCLN